MTKDRGPDEPDSPAALPEPVPVRRLLVLALPALVIGVVAAAVLFVLEAVGSALELLAWQVVPDLIGVDATAGWWTFGVLAATGLLVGLVLRYVPGHGGRDSATTELIADPLPARSLPSLALATVLGLGGGVSLGPENPVIAVTTGVLVSATNRVCALVPRALVVELAAAATIGALFGTPVAAALVFTGLASAAVGRTALWDRLFLPLVSAGTAAVTMTLIAHPQFAVPLPDYASPALADLWSAAGITTVGAGLGVGLAALFPVLHRAVHHLPGPVLAVTLGGVALGLLGVLGGPVTLFNGADEVRELVSEHERLDAAALVTILAVKCGALLIAAASGFRGGRIFPAVFIGTTLGLLAQTIWPSIPLTVAIASGVVGVVLAVARDGWIALFIGVAVTGNVPVLAVLCVAILPAWLVVSRAPEMIAAPRGTGPASPDRKSATAW